MMFNTNPASGAQVSSHNYNPKPAKIEETSNRAVSWYNKLAIHIHSNFIYLFCRSSESKIASKRKQNLRRIQSKTKNSWRVYRLINYHLFAFFPIKSSCFIHYYLWYFFFASHLDQQATALWPVSRVALGNWGNHPRLQLGIGVLDCGNTTRFFLFGFSIYFKELKAT